MYKDKKFKIRAVDDIKEDITSARMHYGDDIRTIFLADGNSIIARTPQLVDHSIERAGLGPMRA